MATKFRMYYIKQIVPDPPAPTLPTVLMPDGKYWTSVDLNIDDGQGGVSIFNDVTVNSVNFGTQYYYTHEAAMRIASNLQGYHLPTVSEWNNLYSILAEVYQIEEESKPYFVSEDLRSTNGWDSGFNGTDDYGFTVLPTGNKVYNAERLEWTGSRSSYWLYDDRPYEDEWTRYNDLVFTYNGVEVSDEIGPFGYRVRLIKD